MGEEEGGDVSDSNDIVCVKGRGGGGVPVYRLRISLGSKWASIMAVLRREASWNL